MRLNRPLFVPRKLSYLIERESQASTVYYIFRRIQKRRLHRSTTLLNVPFDDGEHERNILRCWIEKLTVSTEVFGGAVYIYAK